MDISDFVFVGQWRVHRLNLCSMDQRLGRAARNPNILAVFVLFVEKTYFIKNQRGYNKKTAAKRVSGANGDRPRKRSRLEELVASIDRTVDEETEIESVLAQTGTGSTLVGSLSELIASRRKLYNEYQLAIRNGGLKAGDKGFDPALFDLINAPEVGFTCRRQPRDIYFEEDILIGE